MAVNVVVLGDFLAPLLLTGLQVTNRGEDGSG